MDKLLFVYGTLRKGEDNAHFLQHARCVEAQVYMFAKMYDTGAGYPAIILDGAEKVVGELYEIDAAMLEIVDELEGYEEGQADNLYERITARVFSSHTEYQALVYVVGSSMHSLVAYIPDGDWVKYRKQAQIKK